MTMSKTTFDFSKVKDEKCECGHLKSKHNDRYDKGHGSCQKCGCPQFTWQSFVLKD